MSLAPHNEEEKAAARTVTNGSHVGVAAAVRVPHAGSGEGDVGVLEVVLHHLVLVGRTRADVGETAAGGPEEALYAGGGRA